MILLKKSICHKIICIITPITLVTLPVYGVSQRNLILRADPGFCLAFHPNGKYAYVIDELDGTMTAFAYNPASGALREIQTVATLPTGFDGSNSCAEVRVHPSGAFLYGSNRGHDSIVVYRIDAAQGTLTLVEHESSDIKTPRNFNIDPTGTFCLVANQGADSVVAFRIDHQTGALAPTGHKISVAKPVCIRFSVQP